MFETNPNIIIFHSYFIQFYNLLVFMVLFCWDGLRNHYFYLVGGGELTPRSHVINERDYGYSTQIHTFRKIDMQMAFDFHVKQ